MAELIAYCSRCQKETPSSKLGQGNLCAFCLLDDAIAPLKAEYRRLWAKRQRYLSNPHIRSLDNLHEQLARVARRLGDQVHTRIANPHLAIPIINGHLAQIREEVERPSARILLPRAGDLLKHQSVAR